MTKRCLDGTIQSPSGRKLIVELPGARLTIGLLPSHPMPLQLRRVAPGRPENDGADLLSGRPLGFANKGSAAVVRSRTAGTNLRVVNGALQ